jgi:hypothetical protein
MSMGTDAPARSRSTHVVRNPEAPDGAPGSLRLPAEEARPRPLGASEVARSLLARLAKQTGEHHSVELTRNAKGDVQVKVTVRTDPDIGIDTPEAAAGKAMEVFNMVNAFYPMAAPTAPAAKADA